MAHLKCVRFAPSDEELIEVFLVPRLRGERNRRDFLIKDWDLYATAPMSTEPPGQEFFPANQFWYFVERTKLSPNSSKPDRAIRDQPNNGGRWRYSSRKAIIRGTATLGYKEVLEYVNADNQKTGWKQTEFVKAVDDNKFQDVAVVHLVYEWRNAQPDPVQAQPDPVQAHPDPVQAQHDPVQPEPVQANPQIQQIQPDRQIHPDRQIQPDRQIHPDRQIQLVLENLQVQENLQPPQALAVHEDNTELLEENLLVHLLTITWTFYCLLIICSLLTLALVDHDNPELLPEDNAELLPEDNAELLEDNPGLLEENLLVHLLTIIWTFYCLLIICSLLTLALVDHDNPELLPEDNAELLEDNPGLLEENLLIHLLTINQVLIFYCLLIICSLLTLSFFRS